MSSSLTSVIIPTYNRANMLGRAIESVLQGTYKDVEIIVIDDGSTDNTRQLIQEYGSRVKYIYQENRGQSSARNQGLRHSTGDYIAFLDSDDYYLADNLSEKMRLLGSAPGLGWVFSDYFLTDMEGSFFTASPSLKRHGRVLLDNPSLIFDVFLQYGGVLMTESVLLRRECLEVVGEFDESLKAYEETLFFLKLAKHFQSKFIPKALTVAVAQKSGNVSSSSARYHATFHYIERVKKAFPEDVHRLRWPPRWSKWIADAHNHFGISFLDQGRNNEASSEFFRSILTYPFQRLPYVGLLKCIFA